jgi:hypothetical protein
MYKIELDLTPQEEELVEIAELVRQACWKAATSERIEIANQTVPSTSGLVTTVDLRAVSPVTAYDATGLALYWLVYQLTSNTYPPGTDDADTVMGYIADGVTVREALELLGRSKIQ